MSRSTAAALAAFIALASSPGTAGASVVVDGTRVVYPADRREVTINLRNPGETPSLAQAWLDAGNAEASPGDDPVPFALTPPIFRLDPGRTQTLRLTYTGEPLPTDRESLFWLNVLDIPPRAPLNPDAPNRLELAFKHRLKLFFRPRGLPGSALEAPARVRWRLRRDGERLQLEAVNPTPFHVSLSVIELGTGEARRVIHADMLAPLSSHRFDLPDDLQMPATGLPLEYRFINDQGGTATGAAVAAPSPD